MEWVDCEYCQYEKYEKNPNGILAQNIDQFLIKLMKLIEAYNLIENQKLMEG